MLSSFILVLLASLILTGLTGCVTKGATGDDVTLIQRACDAALPKAFTGYAKFAHKNQYFDLTIEADGLKRDDTGWHWTWLTYQRTSHFPIFSGLTWSSTGEITLGRKP